MRGSKDKMERTDKKTVIGWWGGVDKMTLQRRQKNVPGTASAKGTPSTAPCRGPRTRPECARA